MGRYMLELMWLGHMGSCTYVRCASAWELLWLENMGSAAAVVAWPHGQLAVHACAVEL